jgi:2-polyprenyl-3-methyl-5-hydroxy-6-metoxy-1,4-benzoquinol methylase
VNTGTHQELTTPEYWDRIWQSVQEQDPICAHWSEVGRNGYFLRMLERHTGKLNGKTVVEIGGFMSNRLLAIAKWRDTQVAAIDYAQGGLEPTRRMFARNGCSITLITSDVFAESLHGKYDLVTHWGVLEHFTDPFPLIRRSVELVKPDGHVIFSMPQMRGPGAYLWRKWSPNSWPLHHFHDDAEIYSCFERLEWKCKRIFWGAPLVQISPCEKDGYLQRLLGKAQFGIRQLGRFKVVPFDRGLPYISENRGFVASRRFTFRRGRI